MADDVTLPDPETALRDRATAVYQGYRDRGLDHPTSLGLAANAVVETGADPHGPRSSSGAAGLHQWVGPRLAMYNALHDHDPEEGSLDEQQDHVMWENENLEAPAWKKVQQAPADPVSKAVAFRTAWERPGRTPEEVKAEEGLAAGAARKLMGFIKPGPATTEPAQQQAQEPTIASRVQAARDAGYNDQEIAAYLSQSKTLGPKIDAAKSAGYQPHEIFGHYGLQLQAPSAGPSGAEQGTWDTDEAVSATKGTTGFHYDAATKQMAPNNAAPEALPTPEPPVATGDQRSALHLATESGVPDVGQPPAKTWQWGMPGHENQPMTVNAPPAPPGNVGEDVYKAAREGFGSEPIGIGDKLMHALRSAGIYGPAEGQGTILQRVNEGIISPAAFAADAVMRGGMGAIKGGQAGLMGLLTPIIGQQGARDAAAMIEAFPLAGHELGGLRAAPHVAPLTEAESAAMREAKGWPEAPLTLNPDANVSPDNAFAWQNHYYPQHEVNPTPRLTGPEGSVPPPTAGGAAPGPTPEPPGTPPPGFPGMPESAGPPRGRPLTPEAAAAREAEEVPPTVPTHPAPDGSGALTNLSDDDYAKYKAAPATAPMPPQEQANISTLENIAGGKPAEAPPIAVQSENPGVNAQMAPAETPPASKNTTPYIPEPKPPKSLLPFLQQGVKINQGLPSERTARHGLQDPGGDIKAILGDHQARPGFINNTNGESLDDAGLRAYQAGYFYHRPDVNELLDAIRDEHNGNPLYSKHDQNLVDSHHYAIEHNKEIDQLASKYGLPTKGLTRDEFLNQVADRESQENEAARYGEPVEGLAAGRKLPAPPPQGEDLFGVQRAQPAIRTPEPTIRNDPRQATLEGMEPSAVQAQASRDAATPVKSNQLPTNEGLFARPEVAQPELLTPKPNEVLAPRTSKWAADATKHTFTDLLSEAPTHGQDAAAAWVFNKGRDTGHEYIAVVDNRTGEIVHAGTAHLPGEVYFERNGNFGETGQYTIHHNHPNDTALSHADNGMLANPDISHVVAHTSDGHTTITTLKPEVAKNLTDDPAGIKTNNARIQGVYRAALARAKDFLVPMVESGKVDWQKGNQLWADLANRFLQAAGMIDYKSTIEVPDNVKVAFDAKLKEQKLVPDDRHTESIRPEERVASLPKAMEEQPRQEFARGEDSARNRAGESQGAFLTGESRLGLADGEERGEGASEETLSAGLKLPAPVKKAIDDLKDTPTGASVQRHLTEFLAPMRLGTKETADKAYQFANKISKDQFNYGKQLAGYIRDKFTIPDRWAMGRAQAEQSVFERKLSRDLDALPIAARPVYEAATRARFDATAAGHAGLAPPQRYIVQELSKLADNTWRDYQSRNMVDPTSEGWAHWMPRQLVMMEPGGKARRIVKDDSILGLFGGASSSKGSGRAPDMNPLGTNMHTDVRGFRNYEDVQDTLDAARRKYGPNVHLVDDILGLVGELQRANASIHGHDLLESIVDYGKRTTNPVAYTGGGAQQGYTLAGNPAMYKTRIKLLQDASGKTVAATTPDGKPVWEKVPVWIHQDLYGPLKAVFRAPPNGLEKAFMALKAVSTHFVMQSPLTHLDVELGRALPLMAGKKFVVGTLGMGRRARIANDPRIQLLLEHGMRPITNGFIGDASALMNEANYTTPFGAIGRAIAESRDALARGASKLPGGEFFEKVLKRPIQTLLWNRVLDLQTAIGLGIYEDRLKKGFGPVAAATSAAHLANRYAGALPQESMSRTLNVLANIVEFSRSFTGGNIGIMKDTLTGATQHQLDHIGLAEGQAAQDAAKEWLKNKAKTTTVLDIALYFALTAMIQHAASAVYNAINGTDPEESIGEGYVRRFHEMTQYVQDHPVKALWLPHDATMLLPTADNEPGKKDRARVSPLPGSSQWVYARTPAGKVGEELFGWMTDPGGTFFRKESPFIKAFNEVTSGKDQFGRDIMRPGEGQELHNAWRATEHFLGGLFPTEPESQLYTALGAPGSSLFGGTPPTNKERVMGGAQFMGSLSGLYQPSKGYPLGPAAGLEAERERQIKFDVGEAMPAARRLATAGKEEEAKELLKAKGEDPRMANKMVNGMLPENTETSEQHGAQMKNKKALKRGDTDTLDRAEVIRRSYGLSSGPNTAPP